MNTEQRHTLFLQEMGFPVQWHSKQAKQALPNMASARESAAALQTPLPESSSSSSPSFPSSSLRLSSEPSEECLSLTTEPVSGVATMNWAELNAAVARCTACSLCRERQQTVFGRGDQKPHWLVIGDTPNEKDEVEGIPFAEQEGSLLNNMLRAIGLSIDGSVYFTNLVKCRAQDEAGNLRPPSAEEIHACRPFLQRQIQLMQPRLILALGKTAAQALRSPDVSAGPLRGVVHRMKDSSVDIPMVATWHPSILLRQPAEKRQVWADLCLAKNHHESGV